MKHTTYLEELEDLCHKLNLEKEMMRNIIESYHQSLEDLNLEEDYERIVDTLGSPDEFIQPFIEQHGSNHSTKITGILNNNRDQSSIARFSYKINKRSLVGVLIYIGLFSILVNFETLDILAVTFFFGVTYTGTQKYFFQIIFFLVYFLLIPWLITLPTGYMLKQEKSWVQFLLKLSYILYIVFMVVIFYGSGIFGLLELFTTLFWRLIVLLSFVVIYAYYGQRSFNIGINLGMKPLKAVSY